MSSGQNSAWWTSEDEVHTRIVSAAESISDLQGNRAANFVRYAALYGNNEMFNTAATLYGRLAAENKFSRLSYNIVQSMVDTVVAKHSANSPRIEVLTEGGNFQQQKRAKNSTTLIAGIFDNVKLYRKAPMSLRDSLVFGDGFLKWYVRDGQVHADKIFAGEILADDVESMNGEPRTIYQVRYVSKEVLAAEFPEYAAEIDTCADDSILGVVSSTVSTMVKVYEAWHLPSSRTSGDGKHAIVINNCELMCEEWVYDCFPFTRIQWSPPLQGYYGQGLADQLMGIQLELNKLLKRVQLAFHLMAIPYYLVEAGSKVAKTHLNNEVGHIVEYFGTRPEAVVNQTVHPEVLNHIQTLYSKAYEIAGVSAMESQAVKPVGLESAPSLAEYSDIASERHAYFSQQWQEFFRDCAWQALRCAEEVGNYKVKGTAGKVMKVVKWADCRLDEDEYVFKISAGNLLPTTPSGKLSKVSSMAQAGMLTPAQSLRLLQYPDIEALTGEVTAMDDYMDWAICQMLEEGIYVAPEPIIDLQVAQQRAKAAYLNAASSDMRESDDGEAKLQLLRDYLRDVADLITQAQPPPPPPGMPMPGMAPPGMDPSMMGAPPQGMPPPPGPPGAPMPQ